MPFINSKITVPVPQEKRDILKAELGKAISVLGKTENYLMLGFEDSYDLYFAGKKLDKGAFVSVNLFGSVDSAKADSFTGEVCKLFNKVLGIPGDCIYITYQDYKDWGWNGNNF